MKKINNHHFLETIKIDLWDALLGRSYKYRHPNGKEILIKYENILNPNNKYCIKNLGFPIDANRNGDMIINFLIKYPDKMSGNVIEKLKNCIDFKDKNVANSNIESYILSKI